MKAADFDYVRPSALTEVYEILAEDATHRQIIAGGQTLVPLMALRLARPGLLVDINHVEALAGITAEAGGVLIRACTRQAAVERSPEVARAVPLLAKALGFVGHPPTRNRGTIGGSLANADPAAEIPLVAMALNAELEIASTAGKRSIRSDDFFLSAMETALSGAECLTGARFPAWSGGGAVGTGFHELSLRRGDFAIVAVAVQVGVDGGGICRRATLAVGGAGPAPARIDGAAALLVGSRLEPEALEEAAALAAREIDAHSDPLVSADYRRRVTRALAVRALADARAEAGAEASR